MGLFEYSNAMPFAAKALDYRSLRQDLISSNIANVDTPFYRPKDISFESMLAHEAKEVFNENNLELKLAQTSSLHMSPAGGENGMGTLFIRDGHLARNDGNSVDLDVETTEMGKNGVMYNAIITGIKKHKAVLGGILEASKNVQ